MEPRKIEKNKEGKFLVPLSDGSLLEGDSLLVSTGFKIFDARRKEEYGYGIYENVITSVELENMFYNVLEGKYFDFTQPWWYDDFMSDVSINSNYQFMLGGDYFIDILRCSHCLFYNKSLYEKMYGDSDGLYDIVLAGDWTLEKLNRVMEESYLDLNGNGEKDIDDQFGYVSFEIWGSMIPFLISSDPNYIDRDDHGYP